MSVNNFCNHNPEKDVLQMNMEMVSKELNDLIINCEKDFGTMRHQVQQCNANFPHVATHIQGQAKLYTQQSQQQLITYQPDREFLPTSHNTFYTTAPSNSTFPKSVYPNNSGKLQTTIPTTYPYVVYNEATATTALQTHSNYAGSYSYSATNEYSTVPKYEFHYLRSKTEAGHVTSPPLISISAARDDSACFPQTGPFRKYPKSHFKQYTRIQNTCSAAYDYDSIVVDLSVLGISKDGKESNPVLRLFALFRDLQKATAEVPPALESSADSAYVATFAPLPKVIMPCTMNVQCQVKHAIGQILAFLSSMQHLVAINVVYDHKSAAVCDTHLFKLRQIFAQFEMYKFLDLEHKRGQFINETVSAHAEHLEKLMEQMTRQIREVHLRVIAFDWYIGKNYRRETGRNKSQSVIQDDSNSSMKRSKIGVINEILQMCDNSAHTSAMATTFGTTATITTTTANAAAETTVCSVASATTVPQPTNLKPPQLMNIIQSANNEELAVEAAGVTTNDCIIATTAGLPKSTATMTTASNAHVRQPVFYIG